MAGAATSETPTGTYRVARHGLWRRLWLATLLIIGISLEGKAAGAPSAEASVANHAGAPTGRTISRKSRRRSFQYRNPVRNIRRKMERRGRPGSRRQQGWRPAQEQHCERLLWRQQAAIVALQEGIPPWLFVRLIEQESRFRPTARSSRGAIGLAQLMPATARSLGVNPYHPVENLRGGARYLRQMLVRFDGQIPAALAAYNAGPGAVQRATYRVQNAKRMGSPRFQTTFARMSRPSGAAAKDMREQDFQLPPYMETRRYVRRILQGTGFPASLEMTDQPLPSPAIWTRTPSAVEEGVWRSAGSIRIEGRGTWTLLVPKAPQPQP